MIATDEIVVETESIPSREVRYCEKCGHPVITAPALQCAHCGSIKRLRCFVRRVSECYIAECIDLDIAAEGATLKDAVSGLQDAMDGYLSVALDTNTSGLILRPSPLLHRVRYYIEFAKDLVYGLLSRHDVRTEKFYAVPISCQL
jgi:hypothetical protein